VSSASSRRAPPDPTVVDLRTGRTWVVASINPQIAEWTLAPTELVAWKSRDGASIDGLLTRTSSGGGKAPPLLVMPHGGPDSVSIDAWGAWPQYFAARGYAVFRPNYRGGIGYGRAFYEANRGRLGDIEFADIESGVDHLIATGKADPDRLFYGSWSWGGYLAAWTLGHSKRYRAIMVGAGIVDVAVQYVTSDINHGVIADWEFHGRPWSHPEAFDRPNPSRFLKGASTPTLIIHGQNDARVDFVNARILYRALSDLGVDVTMWAYPREPHGFREPAHIQHMFEVWGAFNDARLPR
jgi:dipeptidyl aminopeptidase/acylaminoacyl peptidase